MAPIPHGPPPATGAFQFGGHDLPQKEAAHHPQNFSFAPINTAPQFPREADIYRPSRSGQDSNGARRRQNRHKTQQDSFNNGRHNNQRPFRGRGNRHHATADRPLLQLRRGGSTPERMIGMNDHEHTENRFLDVDDMSDSVEEAMDESDQDEYVPSLHITSAGDGNPPVEGEKSGNPKSACDGELSINTLPMTTKIENSIPQKWSNPEYYTALPPPDESQRKKRDVIKLIRKARVSLEKTSNIHSQVATNDDFISFGTEENPVKELEGNNSLGSSHSHVRAVEASATTRSSTLYQPLYSTDDNYAPGTNGQSLSSDALGPPPSKIVSLTANPTGTAAEVLEGNRKRKHSVDVLETEPLRPPKRKKGTNPFSNGYVLDDWLSPKPLNPIPWVIRDHRLTEQSGFRLHKEIIDFYEFVKPQEHEQVIRQELLDRLRNVIQAWRADLEVHSFGSFAAGLYLPTADMDLVVLSKDFRNHGLPSVCRSGTQMWKLADYLQKHDIAEPWSIEVVAGAKVPLVKFVDCVTHLKVDMSFENDTGLIANNTFAAWKVIYPAMPIIVTTIKQFLMMRGLNEVVNGGLGGFSVTCLVVSLLQNMPRVQTGEIIPEQNLGEILLEFLDLYGNQLDIARTGIRMEPPGYFDKRAWNPYKAPKPDRLAIMDPNKPDNDISGGSRNVMLIFARFSRARDEILNAMENSNRASLLDWMLGGNYNTFLWQRARLRKLYAHNRGSPGLEDTASYSTKQYRREPVQLNNAGTRSEHQSKINLSMKMIKPADTIPVVTKPNAEKGTVLKDSHNRKPSDHKTLQPRMETKPKGSMHTDINSTAKERAKAMLKEVKRAYLDLCIAQKAVVKQPGDGQRFKAERKESYDVILRWQETLANLENPANNIPRPLPPSQNSVQNGLSLQSVITMVSNDKIGKDDSAHRVPQSRVDDSGFTSRAPRGSLMWRSERRAFLFQRQYPHAEDVPMQLSPGAVKKLIDKYRGVEFVDEVPKKETGGNTPKRTARLTNANPFGGTSQADAIMID
ncbi:hypothetical protein MMC18_005058 [Xylographa bjoerkii]|nr:hypothetical protein [Xylographa bjoerkii]